MNASMNDHQTTILELRRLVARFVAERNWEEFHTPKNLAMSLAIEAAEVMEHFQWSTAEEALAAASDEQKRGEVADELADVLAYLLSLATALQIDLAAALESKMQRNAIKYPRPNQ
ncbi:nucleotide pyrophosphohydrolase [Candidatus Laterigemmans baculatus]|uniref:nucleotide pyrophosphohydrolase n=1 Tax=Candidatus Laterigemmans baculatus TaxID=2770505 RepID=UPI001F1B21A5|nr:nucleotide pyrophosphohydrolase [Candidatus Laterigemmans baculatus]